MKRLALVPVIGAFGLILLPSGHTDNPTVKESLSSSGIPKVGLLLDRESRASRDRPYPYLIRVVAPPKMVKARAARRMPAIQRYVPPAPQPVAYSCSNWRNTLNSSQVYIFQHESGMDPTPNDVNPSSGARGLGQLLESTYRDLGLTPDWNPCDEIIAADKYAQERYGSWGAAEAFWRSHDWW